MCSEEIIKVESIYKNYEVYDTPSDRLKQILLPKLQRLTSLPNKKYYREYTALQDLTFSIKRGETLGIIGKNGSGKSTLLQIISGVLRQTSGSISVFGRVAALLELGSGFNPEFSGRDNIYMYSMLLGLTRDYVDSKFDEIVKFADIGNFIEEPIKIYSSGMVARLAFSVAVQINPDILIVDEALSVGDMAFQEKSFTKMKEIRDSGTSILFVSHSLPAVRNFCEKALWLDEGRLREFGDRLEVCDLYQKEMEEKNCINIISSKNEGFLGADSHLNLDKTIAIKSILSNKKIYKMGEDILIEINLHYSEVVPKFGVGFIIQNSSGHVISLLNTLRDDIFFLTPKDVITLTIRNNHFSPGDYYVTGIVSDEEAMFPYDRRDHSVHFQVEAERCSRGLLKVEGFLRCEHDWS